IALHTTPGVPEYMEPEVALVTAGVEYDVLGLDPAELSAEERDAVTALHPRPGFKRRILRAFAERVAAKPETTVGTGPADLPAPRPPPFPPPPRPSGASSAPPPKASPPTRRPPSPTSRPTCSRTTGPGSGAATSSRPSPPRPGPSDPPPRAGPAAHPRPAG